MAITYEPIASTTITTNTTQITFNSISGSYTDLIIASNTQGTRPTYGGDSVFFFNNDNTSNYTRFVLSGNNGTIANQKGVVNEVNHANMGPASTTCYNQAILTIKDYANTNKWKTFSFQSCECSAGNVTPFGGGIWKSTSAITRIDFKGNGYDYTAGSVITLYGILRY